MPALFDATVYRPNLYALPWAIVGIALLILAAVVFRRQRASRVAVLFCVMIILVASWFGSFAAMLQTTSDAAAVLWAKVALATVCFLPAAIYDFTVTAMRLSEARKRFVRTGWAVSLVFAAISALTTQIVAGVRWHPWGPYPVGGRVLPVLLVFFFGMIFMQLTEGLFELTRTTETLRKRRLTRLMASFALVYLAAVDFLPMMGLEFPPIGYVPVLAFVATAWRSIRKHRLPPITASRASRQILETMADALFVIDSEGRIRVVNSAVKKLLGYSESDLLGKSIDTLEEVSRGDTITRAMRVMARHAIRDQERVMRATDGGIVEVSISISPILEKDVQEGAVIIARDIRQRKRAEEELHEFTRRLEQSNRELEDFAYVASHDLQEPLRKIQAFGDLLKKKHAAEMPEQARDYIDRMQSAARRMQILINDLLSFSRVTTKAQPFAPVQLGVIAAEVVRDLEVRIHESGAMVTIEELPTLEADHLQIRQLLQNLIGNALKFRRPDVPPRVVVAGSQDRVNVYLTVSDNGIGFEQKYADRIFTMFERLHGRSEYEGTGIGLAICRKIVERHGGSISVESAPGSGSTFRVVLPLFHHAERAAHA